MGWDVGAMAAREVAGAPAVAVAGALGGGWAVTEFAAGRQADRPAAATGTRIMVLANDVAFFPAVDLAAPCFLDSRVIGCFVSSVC